MMTVHARALGAILNSYKALLEHMDEIQASGRDEYALKAVGYLQSLEKSSDLTWLISYSQPQCSSLLHCRVRILLYRFC